MEKTYGLRHANPKVANGNKRVREGKGVDQGDGVTGDFLHFLDESGWGEGRAHARIHGAAEPKLRIS